MRGLQHAHCIFFLDRQSKQMFKNLYNVDRIITTEISGDDLELQQIILKQNIHTPYGDINPDAVCMKHPDTLCNKRRNNNNTSVNNGNSITRNVAEDTVKVLCIFEDCRALRIELHELNKFRVPFKQNSHRFCINEFSDLSNDETEPFFCNKTCKAGFPDILLDMTAE